LGLKKIALPLIFLLIIPLFTVPANATPVTIDFGGLIAPTNSYTEDGFILTTDGQFNVGNTFGNPPPNMFPALTTQVNTLTKQDGGSFDLISIDIRELNLGVGAGPIEFTAVKTAGGIVSQTFNTDGVFGWETFVFIGFTAIDSMSWDDTNPDNFVAFDNIVLEIDGIQTVGGELIPLDTTSLILAGTQMNAAWMIPVIVSAIGIGIVIARKF